MNWKYLHIIHKHQTQTSYLLKSSKRKNNIKQIQIVHLKTRTWPGQNPSSRLNHLSFLCFPPWNLSF